MVDRISNPERELGAELLTEDEDRGLVLLRVRDTPVAKLTAAEAAELGAELLNAAGKDPKGLLCLLATHTGVLRSIDMEPAKA